MKKTIIETLNTIPAMLSQNFKKFANRPAMILDGGRSISYNDMRWDIFKTSDALRSFNGTTPKTVAIFIDDSPQAVETIYSVLSIGAKAVLLRYTMSAEEVKTALDEQTPDVIFIRSENMGLLPQNFNAGILEMADNRILKTVERSVHEEQIKQTVSQPGDAEREIVVTYSHGMQSTVLTRKDFVELAEKKKKNTERSFDALVEYIGSLVKAFIAGDAVKACLN